MFAAGRQIFIYPEGTRRLPGAPPIYKQGVAALYVAGGRPLPAGRRQYGAVLATARLFAPAGRRGDRISAAIAPGLDRAAFSERLQSTIETACDRLNAEAVEKDPSLAAVVAEGASSEPETLRPA